MHDVTLGYAIAAAILVIAAVLFYKSKAKFDTNLFGFKIPDGKMYRFTLTPPLANDTWAIQALSFQTSDLTRFFAFVTLINKKAPHMFSVMNVRLGAVYHDGDVNFATVYALPAVSGHLKNVSETTGTGVVQSLERNYEFRWKRTLEPYP